MLFVSIGTYCMPEEGVPLKPTSDLLTSDEIIRLIKLFVSLGVNKVRFTGGEPLVRKDLLEIVVECGKIQGLDKIAMTTNGIALARKAKLLKAAGMLQLNISLDTLEEKKFEFIAKRKGFGHVMNSIATCLELGFKPLKVNC